MTDRIESPDSIIATPGSQDRIIHPTADDPYGVHRMFRLEPVKPGPGAMRRQAGVTRRLMAWHMNKAKMYAELLEGVRNGRCTLGPPNNRDRLEIIDPEGVATGFDVTLEYAKEHFGVTDYRDPAENDPFENSEPAPSPGTGKLISGGGTLDLRPLEEREGIGVVRDA
jgi:hypothetical protein